MSRNKQRYSSNSRTPQPTAPVEEIKPVEEVQEEVIEQQEEVQGIPETVEAETIINATSEPSVEDENFGTPIPEVTETILDNPVVNLEEEEANKVKQRTEDLLTESEVMDRVSLTAKMALYGVLDYVAKVRQHGPHILYLMADRNYVVHDGPNMQAKLFRDIMDIITKTDDASFRYAMDFLMQLFNNEKDVFSLENLSRFSENIPLSAVELKCYPNLMVILTTLCDPVTRVAKSRSSIDMREALKFGFSEAAKTRILGYFSS